MRLVLFGPPGAGKGTQAVHIAAHLGVPHISTGDIFRENVRGETSLGQEAKRFMDRGDLVPDEVVNRMVADRLARPDCDSGFVLDGYPRTVEQAKNLDELLADLGETLDAVLSFEVDSDELFRRLSRRAEQEDRTDDTPEVIRNRLAVYTSETAPLEAWYRDRGLLRRIDGMGAVDDITQRALRALEGGEGDDLA